MTWATSVPILVFLGLSILDLGPIYATDVRRASSLNAPAMGAGHNNEIYNSTSVELQMGTSARLLLTNRRSYCH